MTRRSNDLLSIFDANQQAQRKAQVHAAARARSGRGATPRTGSPKTRATGRGFQGLWLSPRQVVLAGCVGTLLFLLTFFVGLAMGRPGADGAATTSLRRDAGARPSTAVLLGLKVKSMDMTTGRRVEGDEVRRQLARLGLGSPYIHSLNEHDGQWHIEAGPFASAEAVDTWIQQRQLGGAQVAGSMPFHHREIRPYPGR